MRKLMILNFLLSAALGLAACSPGSTPSTTNLPAVIRPVSAQAASDQTSLAKSQADPLRTRFQSTNCPIPAGWTPYQIQINETIYSVAARSSLSADTLLKANCLTSIAGMATGAWLYVPSQAAATSPQTLLPLGISAFVADPLDTPAGGIIHLAWQTMGPVVRVRVGWVYEGQFIEEASSLPQTGVWQLQVPADGRDSITYMIRASDGLTEVAAQTTVRISCPQAWFYAPAPTLCPFPPLVTLFQQQAFERGVIVYLPALRLHYVFVAGQGVRQMADTFVPGMPLKDAALDAAIPAGLRQPTGAIFYAWRSDHALQAALGYAVGDVQTYTGMHQRAITPGGETVSFSTGSGQVYQVLPDGTWQAITPQ
jgi:hypothetical protein